MASTNKTTNYELSQYIGTDKPTYLTDYNQDMSKIDAGIHAAKSEADTNASSIGTLSSLTTTAKTSLVAAINEIDNNVDTLTGTVGTNTTNIASNTSAIGTLANLTTTNKGNLVAAINEVDGKEFVSTSFASDSDVLAPSINAVKSRYDETSLFTDSDGTTGNVTLSSSAANFDKVEIFFRLDDDNTDVESSVTVWNPNTKRTVLSKVSFNARTSASAQAVCSIISEEVLISGTSITRNAGNRSAQMALRITGTGTPDVSYNNIGVVLKIVKVVGYHH